MYITIYCVSAPTVQAGRDATTHTSVVNQTPKTDSLSFWGSI